MQESCSFKSLALTLKFLKPSSGDKPKAVETLEEFSSEKYYNELT